MFFMESTMTPLSCEAHGAVRCPDKLAVGLPLRIALYVQRHLPIELATGEALAVWMM